MLQKSFPDSITVNEMLDELGVEKLLLFDKHYLRYKGVMIPRPRAIQIEEVLKEKFDIQVTYTKSKR